MIITSVLVLDVKVIWKSLESENRILDQANVVTETQLVYIIMNIQGLPFQASKTAKKI